MSRNKVRADRVIILILIAILVGGALGFGVYKLIGLFSNDSKENVTVQTSEGVRLSLNDYTIYYDETNELGFNFIVANINFSSNESVSYDLGNLQTSEKITLNDVSKYLNKLENASFDLKKLAISSSVVSESNNVNANIFIPYTTDSNNLAIYNSFDASNSINIDLTKSKVAVTSLKLSDNTDEIVVGNTSVFVSKAYISTFMLHNDEPYEIGSSSRIYSFEITVKETKDNVKISDAVFIKNGSSDEVKCISSDYKSVDMDNILDKNLSVGSNGGLFFEIHTTSDYVEDGILLIKFSNSNDWVEISTLTE